MTASVAIAPDDPSVTKQTMYNAYLHFCAHYEKGKEYYPTYSDWICSNHEQVHQFMQGWKCAWESANKEKETE